MQMIRMGDLVGLRYDVKSADDDFAIFNVLTDTHQANNLAAAMPQLQKQMKDKVLQVRRTDTSARRTYDDVLIPTSVANTTTPGLTWKAYNGQYLWLPETSTLTAAATGKSAGLDGKETNAGHTVYLFEGYIKVPEDGEYTFYLSSGGKAFLRIHEASVIDEDYGYKAGTVKEGSVKLKAGLHAIKITCSGKPGDLNLEWKGAGFAKTKIPANAFYR